MESLVQDHGPSSPDAIAGGSAQGVVPIPGPSGLTMRVGDLLSEMP